MDRLTWLEKSYFLVGVFREYFESFPTDFGYGGRNHSFMINLLLRGRPPMTKGPVKASTATMAVLIATIAIVTTVYMQAQAKTDRATITHHKIIACATAANGPECEKIRPVVAK
jgi:hypothetical protein